MPVGTDVKEDRAKIFDEQQLVVFELAGEEFGVNINKVKEIIRWEDVTRIPNSAPYIKGVINLRGSIIVINDLAMKMGLPSKTVDDDTRILVVEVGDNTVGMIVDSATEVLRLEGEKIKAAPSMVTNNIDRNYIEGVGLLDEKRLLTLLDLSKVLESKDYEHIMQAQQMASQAVEKVEDLMSPDTKESGSASESELEASGDKVEEPPKSGELPREVPVVEEKPELEETSAVDETVKLGEAPELEEAPKVEKAAKLEEMPGEAPKLDETVKLGEAPVVEETHTVDKTTKPRQVKEKRVNEVVEGKAGKKSKKK